LSVVHGIRTACAAIEAVRTPDLANPESTPKADQQMGQRSEELLELFAGSGFRRSFDRSI
jgi:hypothetical protein